MSIYKSTEAKEKLMNLYDQKLASLNIKYEDIFVDTSHGKTHLVNAGNPEKPAVAVLHGINAGAPMTLEAIKGLLDDYNLYVIDSIGQTTRSAETRLPVKDNSYGLWLKEVLDKMQFEQIPVIAVSYGAFLLQKLLAVAPEKVSKAVFVVPAGFSNGKLGKSMKELTFPLIKFNISKKDDDLRKFMSAFYKDISDFDIAFQRNTLLGVKMDYRKPPLVNKADVAEFKGEVYIIAADNDAFFPGPEAIEKCKQTFSNFKESYTLKNCKHFPGKETFPLINEKVKQWLGRGEPPTS